MAALLQTPKTRLIDTHVHLFSADRTQFPFAPGAPYQPPAALPVEEYVAFAPAIGVEHAVIVHPEPYQDDHSYLEYCFSKEPSPGFFKGTCLFDPIDPATPGRIKELMERNPKRIVALRIHETHAPGTPSLTKGAIKDRDLASPQMAITWREAQKAGLRMQMHFLPFYAPQIDALARKFQGMPVILDHLGRGWQGTPAEFEGVLKLAKHPHVYIKIAEIPDASAAPLVRRAFDAFGPERLIWGDLGHDSTAFAKQSTLFETLFRFLDENGKNRIRYANAKSLFGF